MIASLHGEVGAAAADSLVIRVGGVGLRVYVTTALRTQARQGTHLDLHTHLVVREDALSLYGFEQEEERDFFLLLLGVDGVGPRIALAVLSVLSPDAIRRAVINEQGEIFSRVPGVGKRTAQKILLHLQGRVGSAEKQGGISSLSEVEAEVISALTGLGYSIIEAQTALQAVPRDAPPDVESRLRLALQYFTR
jgi:Holliday junction DNA helicase RuvA